MLASMASVSVADDDDVLIPNEMVSQLQSSKELRALKLSPLLC